MPLVISRARKGMAENGWDGFEVKPYMFAWV